MSAWVSGAWKTGAWYGTAWYDSGGTPPTPTPDVIKTGGKGDDGKRKKAIFKPTGLDYTARPTVDERVQQTEAIHAEVSLKQIADEEYVISEKPVQMMTQAEIDFEIGILLRKKIRSQEDELLLLMLMMA